MSNFNPDTPPFIPTFLRQPAKIAMGDEGRGHVSLVQHRGCPLVFLIFGCRGAGKTTQSERLAKEYNLLQISSGDIYLERKQPFVELRKILLEEFGEGKERRFNGVVLDRFVAISEFDAFYIQSALDAVKLPVPFVFVLAIDPALAAERAGMRRDNKVAYQYWRAIEQKAQTVTGSAVYAPIGCLKTVRVTKEKTVEDVFGEIKTTIQTQLPVNPKSIKLPPAARCEAKGMKLIDNYEDYMELVVDVHAAVGNVSGRRDTAPLSTIGAYLDKEYFSFGHKNLRSLLSTFHVTLKADGQRYLFVKHKCYGYIGFPAAFTHCYDVNKLFEGVEMSCEVSPESQKFITDKKGHDRAVEILFDTELVIRDGNPVFYVLDYLYLGGLEGKQMRFEARLKVLRDFFGRLASATSAICLKDYVPINMLRTLMPKWQEAKIPIDGLVFQHGDVYKIGRDKFLVKWKPVEHCTVDFRLANGVLEGSQWIFELMVTDDVSENRGFGEIPYEGARATIPATVVHENLLCNGIIVELELMCGKGATEGEASPAATRWSFRGVRNDKPSPNKYSIVKKIVELKHLSLEELVELCEKIPFYGSS
ncbi:RNA guanylyltransferase [Trypanosoma rangeli]|uniref:RNA guanylyltransferase n=1 Tax=Trypanosoma rangeli TaxID=5698 RepID=A0A422P1D1_TRYRA|nr:RNA guanylyltransferase [Trypanosoma rangeli]RNF11509.1 RNA guanylyltransferase [Trypanosoma rangeli]|eukprot:RNF11509.1 RNA guanylyltransferase [Trypanosoma rangeli]